MRDLHTRLGGLQGECGQISADYTHKGRAENYQKSQWDVTLNKEARKQSEITMAVNFEGETQSKDCRGNGRRKGQGPHRR